MGIIESLKKALRGGGESPQRDGGLYYYVRLDRSGEVVKIRLDPQHDLAPDYQNGGYFSNKAIIGPESIERADATFYFDEKKSFTRADIHGGELSDEEAYRV